MRPAGWGLREYYRRQSEELRGLRPKPRVRLQVPAGISHVLGLSGQTYPVREGIVEVGADEVPP